MEAAKSSSESYEVVIAGLSMRLKTNHSEDMVKSLVSLVDQKIQDVLKASKNSSLQNAAVLAALNLADELLSMKQRTDERLDRLESLAHSALSDLESSRISQAGLAPESERK
jgi:cell division protein ZapA